eukprot:1351675-Rhodomonas_salina.1
MKQVAPLFEKPQERLKAAEGGRESAVEGGSAAAAAASGAAGSSDPEPIIIDDGDGAATAAVGSTECDDVTESEEEKMPGSSTDTDSQAELPLSAGLTEQLSAFVAQEKAITGKRKRKVWSESEKQLVIDVWREKKMSDQSPAASSTVCRHFAAHT